LKGREIQRPRGRKIDGTRNGKTDSQRRKKLVDWEIEAEKQKDREKT
jgi:hypothetical protein